MAKSSRRKTPKKSKKKGKFKEMDDAGLSVSQARRTKAKKKTRRGGKKR